MWISKRKWNEMEDRMDILERRNIQICELIRSIPDISDKLINYGWLVSAVRKLELAHKNELYTDIDSTGHACTKNKYIHERNEPKASTSNIKDVTLEELARLVIDHEPIVREENVKVKVEYR